MLNPITIPPSPIKPDSKSSLEGYKIIDDYFDKNSNRSHQSKIERHY